MSDSRYLLKNGMVYDGSGEAPRKVDVLISDGVVEKIAPNINVDDSISVIDATGKWVTPGFLDTHTHYDAELLINPGLGESVMHGVTTVVTGSCSISMILSEALDCSDMFTRVESVPREQVLPLLEKMKTWNDVRGYLNFLKQHPLGPNLASYLGHSDLRTRVMGLERSTSPVATPSETELQQMSDILEDGLKQGLLGLSTMTTKWDKIDGDRFRSASLPSTYARWKEFRRLNSVLRKHDRIHQGAPDIVTKWNTVLFFFESLGWWRKKLKTTLITLMDAKASPLTVPIVAFATRIVNMLRADFRWQALPNTFEVYADGMDLVVFEEFGAGEAALHLQDELERNELLKDQSYRRRFRKDYDKKWGSRVWQRDFYDAQIIDCPDKELNGQSFGQVADQRGLHPADLFLDLVVEYGKKLRWHTVIANHRPKVLEKIVTNKDSIISFADSGAHIRNMAYYNFPLRLLKLAQAKVNRGDQDLSIEKAVHRLSGELADWYDLDAGYIREGARADINVIDPAALQQPLDAYHEAPMQGFEGLDRMVNRNPGVVCQVFINGRLACEDGKLSDDLGRSQDYGSFLSSKHAGAH